MSSMIVNHVSSHLPLESYKFRCSLVSKLHWNQAPKLLRTLTFKCEEYLKQNHSNHPFRYQSSLESSSKASRNAKRLQISEIYRFKPL